MGSQEFGAARGRALEDYSAATAREQSTYQRGYLDPLSRAGTQAQIGLGVTQNLAQERASYADRIAGISAASSQTQSAAILGRASTTSAAISGIGRAYQNRQNEPDY